MILWGQFAIADRIPLNQANWSIQNSQLDAGTGAAISSPGYPHAGWTAAQMPTTVVAALVQAGTYLDPDWGMNLRLIPGTSYPIGQDFSLQDLAASSPFNTGWWYRAEFTPAANLGGRTLSLHFDGINYQANIFLNGSEIATTTDVAGMFRAYDFDVTQYVHSGQVNALAVQIFPPKAASLAGTWVDWNPMPADKNMGIYRDVYLTSSGPVTLRDPQVTAVFANANLTQASLTVEANLTNRTAAAIEATVDGTIEQLHFTQTVKLAAHATQAVTFAPADFRALIIANPRVWWPNGMGKPELYPLKLTVSVADAQSENASLQFGIRTVTSSLTSEGYRLFKINRKPLLIRGGGWASDLLLRASPIRQEQELRYVQDLGLNTIRMEGKFESDDFLNLTDRYGILVMAGWPCCSFWENAEAYEPDPSDPPNDLDHKAWKTQDYAIAAFSERDQILKMRGHPSTLAWLYGSDSAPPEKAERAYLKVLKDNHWTVPSIAAASDDDTVAGKTGVKMTGPYDYVPPVYWYITKTNGATYGAPNGTETGGAYGFNTETSVGPAVPVIESLRKMLPPDHLWPLDSWFDFHAGSDHFADLHVFNQALQARYGAAQGLEEYVTKAQVMAYDGHRAMFEAYGKNKYASATGVVQWMLNNAWPSLIWHLYDWYLQPGGSYFGAKKANEAIHVQYSYDDQSVVVVNNRFEIYNDLNVKAQVLNFDLSEKWSSQALVSLAADAKVVAFTLPALSGLTPTYFLKLDIEDASGAALSHNFYWLSTRHETFDWNATDFTRTPTVQEADFTQLNSLVPAQLSVASQSTTQGSQGLTQASLTNTSDHLAFFLRLKLTRGTGGAEVLPVIYGDNYISLLPGEMRAIDIHYGLEDLGGTSPALQVSGWNVPPTESQ